MIRTECLTKEYNGFKAVDNLNLKVKPGDIYGFLGPNGAGKTTTILMLLGIVKPTKGNIYIFDQDLTKNTLSIKKKIGVVSENQYLYREMTASEYLTFFADLYRVRNKRKRIAQLLQAVNLLTVKNKKLGTFSRGMQQKLGFIRALLHDPKLLLLDEPVSGLDPKGIKQIRDLIEEENKKGKTIFISSHLLSELEKLCKIVGIINKGKLLAEDSIENIKRKLTEKVEFEIEITEIKKGIIEALSTLDFVDEISGEENILIVKVKENKDYRAQISKTISQHGGIVLGMKTKGMSLEEAFITITEENISLLTKERR